MSHAGTDTPAAIQICRARREHWLPWTGDAASCELPSGCWEANSGVLESSQHSQPMSHFSSHLLKDPSGCEGLALRVDPTGVLPACVLVYHVYHVPVETEEGVRFSGTGVLDGSERLAVIMRPDDANVAGNVHGGTILKMIEEAGAIISTRHCNSQNGERCVAALARVERTDFLSPMCIGEVAHVSAEITYTSKHSVEAQVHVMSENILTGTKKLTNKATLWYVPLSLKNVDKVLEVPPIVYLRQEQEEEGRKRYEAQKLERMETKWRNGDIVQPVLNPEPNTVSYSQSSLIHLVGPSDCTLHGFVHGGVTMKLMDEVAGIVAARHCKTNIVTASVDAINFHDKIRKGCVITISGRMTFTSNKSMEIEVLVDADPVVDNSQKRYRAASAFFTYVSLNQEGKPMPVPQLVPETEDEKKRFEEGKGRYLQMKAKRQGHTEPQP